MLTNIDTDERRSFLRMLVDVPVNLQLGERQLEGTCLDISGKGMAVELKEEACRVGDRVSVHLSPANKLLPAFEAEGVVARVIAQDGAYKVGLELTSVT